MRVRSRDDASVRQLATILAVGDGAPRELPSIADWPGLLRLADAAALAPALWSGARRSGLLEPVPDLLLPHLRSGARAHPAALLQAAHQANAARTRDLRDQLLDVLAVLAAHRVETVALKGTAMVLAGVWPDAADRQMADVDLLVPQADAMRARAALLSLGYGEDRPLWRSLHHLPPLRRPGRHGTFELHVRPVTNAWRRALTAEEVVATATRTTLGGTPVLVPAADVLATHALAHAYLTDSALARSSIPLRTTFELWRMERHHGPLDWPAVRTRLARVSRGRVVDRHRRTAAVLFDGERDRRAERSLAPAMAMLRWPALRQAWHTAWRGRHLLDGDRLREHYGDERGALALRAHHLRQLARRRSG